MRHGAIDNILGKQPRGHLYDHKYIITDKQINMKGVFLYIMLHNLIIFTQK